MPLKPDSLADVLDRYLLLLTTCEDVQAVGLSGSRASGNDDAFSDVNLCVYCAKSIPSGEERLRRYRDTALGDLCTFDRNLEPVRSDTFKTEETVFDVSWVSVPSVERFLHNLKIEFDCDEFLPGTLLLTESLYDPGKVIEKLKGSVPEYPLERAHYRVRRSLETLRFDSEISKGLEAAAVRGDVFHFLKLQHELLEAFLKGLFALNRRWFCHEKRLLEAVRTFPILSAGMPDRLESILVRKGADADLASCYDHMELLFGEFASIARSISNLPTFRVRNSRI